MIDAANVQRLLDLLNPLHGALDEQTYDEKRTGENGALGVLDDCEFAVTITSKMEGDLTKAVCMLENAVKDRIAPVQGYAAGIPWSMHMRAYDVYCKKYGPQQALIEGRCRGGFGVGELDMFIPGWRDELSEMAALKAALKTALDHVEHMGAFIAKQNVGYSFESLGEDMPGMRAALRGDGQSEKA